LLSKPEYKGTTLTSDIKDVKQPVKLTINTPVTGIDLDAKEYAKKLEQNINDVIKIEKNKKLIVEDSYVI
ncbi:hypothetical protein COM24_34560, partial [Bacillus toyonensis]